MMCVSGDQSQMNSLSVGYFDSLGCGVPSEIKFYSPVVPRLVHASVLGVVVLV